MANDTRNGSKSSVIADPRLTQRKKLVAKKKTRKRLWIVGSIVVVVALIIGAWGLLHTSLFSAKTVTVSGALHESDAQVIAAGSLSGHPALITINAGASEAGIDSLAWIKTSTVSIHWPTTVKVTVTERVPVAVVSSGTDAAVVDASGRILVAQHAPTPAQSAILAKGLIPVTTAKATPLVEGRSVASWALPAFHVAATLPIAFKDQVASVQANPDGTVTLQLTTPITVNMGPDAQLVQKYDDIASVIAGATLHPGDVLDVSVPQASTITGP